MFADDPTLQFEKHLGDIVIAPSYVDRVAQRDYKDFKVSLKYEDIICTNEISVHMFVIN